MPEVRVLAPATFGADAQAFVDAAVGELRQVAAADGMVLHTDAEVVQAVAEMRPGSTVLGSISSDFAVVVAGACRLQGLQHVEVGAVSDRVLGPGTLRLTAAAADTAAAVNRLVGGRRFLVVAEESEFAAAVVGELGASRGLPVPALAIEEALDRGLHAVLDEAGVELVVAVLRPPWPEKLLASMPEGSELIGAGSWARREVGLAAACSGVLLRFCDVMPAHLLTASELAPGIAASLELHLKRPRSVYRDLGWAGGLLLRQHLGVGRSLAGLSTLELGPSATGFGHGVRFGPEGRNLAAGKAILEWADGELRLIAKPLGKETNRC